MPYCHFLTFWTVAFLPVSLALRTQVLSSFVFLRHGDRTPLYSPDDSVLTPYGANQMRNAGLEFRNRYLNATGDDDGQSTTIRDISHYQLNADELTILTSNLQYTGGSAQAFMQGLYPPLGEFEQNYTQMPGISELADGTNVVGPLNGYQYPQVRTASSYDVNSVWVDGAANCPAYTGRMVEYYNSSAFDYLYHTSLEFYRGLEDDFLENTFSPNNLGYFDSYYIWDWLQYHYLHNSTVRNTISDVNMTTAESLAVNWIHAMYANATDPVKSIAGRSLAAQILTNFYNAVQMEGRTNKLNLWFGDFAPMVSLAALAGLTSEQNTIFYNIPAMGSSFVFELVSLLAEDEPNINFPNISDLHVRFLYKNGTDEYSKFVPYSLFGRSPSQPLVPYAEFIEIMSDFSLSGVREWCLTCGSYSLFCPAYTGVDNSPFDNGRKNKNHLSPAVAGVIGAIVALAIAAILFGLLMALAGVRLHRQGGKKKSSLAGFKGSQKLASDQDLTLPKGGAGATVDVTEPDAAHGHARIGSWELKKQAKLAEAGQMGAVTTPRTRRPSYEDDEIHVDPFAPAVKPHDHV